MRQRFVLPHVGIKEVLASEYMAIHELESEGAYMKISAVSFDGLLLSQTSKSYISPQDNVLQDYWHLDFIVSEMQKGQIVTDIVFGTKKEAK